jgi:hypothetical protein
MILVDAILEALSHTGLLSNELVPEKKEDRKTTVSRWLIVIALLVIILLPLYFAFR